MPHISDLKLNAHLEFVEIIAHKIEFPMLFNMAQIVNLLLISEPDANNEPEHIIAICYTEISLHIKHFMKHKTY